MPNFRARLRVTAVRTLRRDRISEKRRENCFAQKEVGEEALAAALSVSLCRTL
jgi:hypothetical protein